MTIIWNKSLAGDFQVDQCFLGYALTGGGRLVDDGGYALGNRKRGWCGNGDGAGGRLSDRGDGMDVRDLETGVGNGSDHVIEGLVQKIGHDESGRLCWRGNKQADLGRGNAGGVGRRVLRKDGVGFGISDVNGGDGTEIETAATDVEFCGAFAVSNDSGNNFALCAHAFGDSYAPAATDFFTWRRKLGEDLTFRNFAGKITILANQG